jgi:hypothetical protein
MPSGNGARHLVEIHAICMLPDNVQEGLSRIELDDDGLTNALVSKTR